jgi:hypothetical protein
MAATGTAAAGTEGIPTGAAAVVKIFRMSARRAKPAMRRLRLPFAQRAANTAEIGIVLGLCSVGAAGVFDREFFLKQQEDYKPVS